MVVFHLVNTCGVRNCVPSSNFIHTGAEFAVGYCLDLRVLVLVIWFSSFHVLKAVAPAPYDKFHYFSTVPPK